MKDARFNELLNLYLDHRLSAADAAELEAEVMRNPDRRRIYNGYCRMQRACHVLFENERESAPQSCALSRALAEVNRKLSGEVVETRSFAWLGWSGAVAAACVVVVSIGVATRETPGVEPTTMATVVAATDSPAVALDDSVSPAAVVTRPVATLASVQTVTPVAPPPPVLALAPQPTVEQQQWSRIAAQRWIDAEAASLMASRLVEDDRFVIHHAADNGEVPTFQVRQMQTASTRGELTSYQFQR